MAQVKKANLGWQKWRKAAKIVLPTAVGAGLATLLSLTPVERVRISRIEVGVAGIQATPVPYSVAELIHEKPGGKQDTLFILQTGEIGARLGLEPIATKTGIHWIVLLGPMLDAKGRQVVRFQVFEPNDSVGKELVFRVTSGRIPGKPLVVTRFKDLLLQWLGLKKKFRFPGDYGEGLDPKILKGMRGTLEKTVEKARRENALGIQKSLERERRQQLDKQPKLKKKLLGQPVTLVAPKIFPRARRCV